MSAIATTDDLFFNRAGLDRTRAERTVADALNGGDDGELFLEFNQSEALSLDDGKLKSASFDVTQGFGLRAVAGEAHAYAHASDLSDAALQRAAATVKAVHKGYGGTLAQPPQGTNRHLYSDDNPLAKMEFGAKVTLLQEIDAYARAKDPRVKQVMASLSGV
ncbi:MAG TPA: DNA gyrase modulator, partial [Dongiaceae bacterium]